MKLFFCSTDVGCFEFLFTTDEQRATELLGIYIALAKINLTKLWFTELTPDTVVSAHRLHRRNALESRDDLIGTDVPGVQDQLDAVERLEQLGPKHPMRVGDEPYPVFFAARHRVPTWIAAIPKVSERHDTSTNPASFMRLASSSSAGKCATDAGRYSYAVRWPLMIPPMIGSAPWK